MTASVGTEAVRAVEKTREANRARQRKIAALERERVPGTELTPAQLAEVQPRLKRECAARNPEWVAA